MDDIIKALSELLSQSPKPKGGIADSMKGADFIGRRLTRSEVGDNAIIGSKLTDASRFNPFSVRNIGVNNRYIMMREYADDLAKRFEQTIQFIKNNPDVRLTQAQKDNILYNVGVYRRVSKEKNKIEQGLTEQGKNVDEIFNNRTQSLPDEMLTVEDQLEKFFRNIEKLQKKVKETESIFDDTVPPERKERLARLYYGKGYTNNNSSLYRGLGSNFLPKLHEAGIIKLDDKIYDNLKNGRHHHGGAMTFAPDPIRIWRYHFGDDVFDKMDNWNYNDGETVFEWLKRNNIEPVVKSGPSSATDYMHPVEIMERLKEENKLFNVYKNPKAESSQGYINIDDPKQQLDRIGFHGENIRFLEDSLQKSSPDDFREYMAAKPKPEKPGGITQLPVAENFLDKMEKQYTEAVKTKKELMPDSDHPNYELLQQSLRDAEDALTALKITRNKKLPEDQQKEFFDKLRTRNIGRESRVKLNIEDYMKDETAPSKAGKGRFTKAEVLIQRLQNTLKTDKDPYVQENFPNFIRELQDNPELANNPNVQEAFGLTDLSETTNQRLVEYDDGTLDFFTKGQKKGMGSVQQLVDEFGISFEEATKIKTMEPEDQVLEIERLRTLLNRDKPKNAEGGLIGLHI